MPRRPISHLEDSIAELRNANKVGRFLIGFAGPVLGHDLWNGMSATTIRFLYAFLRVSETKLCPLMPIHQRSKQILLNAITRNGSHV
jgi:hypothetical protein